MCLDRGDENAIIEIDSIEFNLVMRIDCSLVNCRWIFMVQKYQPYLIDRNRSEFNIHQHGLRSLSCNLNLRLPEAESKYCSNCSNLMYSKRDVLEKALLFHSIALLQNSCYRSLYLAQAVSIEMNHFYLK